MPDSAIILRIEDDECRGIYDATTPNEFPGCMWPEHRYRQPGPGEDFGHWDWGKEPGERFGFPTPQALDQWFHHAERCRIADDHDGRFWLSIYAGEILHQSWRQCTFIPGALLLRMPVTATLEEIRAEIARITGE